jgi:aldehyde dehydrogenase (NAD+)
MYQAGQSCIAVQRVYVHEAVFDAFSDLLLAAVADLSVSEDVGPLISDEAADRVASWVDEAVAGGGLVLCGGTRDGRVYAPTVLTGVSDVAKVVAEEVFGPVLVLSRVPDVDEAFARVNDSRFGLQAGVFTSDLQVAFRAARELDVGGVVIGDVPSYRADQMPYGGVKDSGSGREGVRSAMLDLTEERVLVLTGLDL